VRLPRPRGLVTLGGIEAGGTKWVCAVGEGPDRVGETVTLATTTPEETLGRAIAFLQANGPLEAVGIGSFGPVGLRRGSPQWGHITTTPKPGWADTDVAGRIGAALAVPVAFDTDVNAAALGEHLHGAARGLDTFAYVTVGTGIGGGVYVNGSLLHGLIHPEIGHMRIPHDRARDPFDGVCPYHGDCLEGLASGEAIRARWQTTDLPDEAVALEAEYLAQGMVNLIFALSPQQIVIGGGVMRQPGLLERTRARARELVNGYLGAPELDGGIDRLLVPPTLGDRAGITGALALAAQLVPVRPG
jgi:fructokinase